MEITERMGTMGEKKTIRQQYLTGERALFMSSDLSVVDCTFAEGESPLKESHGIELEGSMFKWKYPLWYCKNIVAKNCAWFDMARAGVWYTNNVTVENTPIDAPKNFRRCMGVTLRNVSFSNAEETLWSCDDVTLEHVTEGHLIASDLAKEGYMLAVGPTLGHATKFELKDKSWITPGVLANAGCHVSIITDSPVIPQKYLPICAGLAVKAGMDPFDALQAITINPAKHIGVEVRVGSLEAGKDADVVLVNGDPMVSDADIRCVIVDGKILAGNK